MERARVEKGALTSNVKEVGKTLAHGLQAALA